MNKATHIDHLFARKAINRQQYDRLKRDENKKAQEADDSAMKLALEAIRKAMTPNAQLEGIS